MCVLSSSCFGGLKGARLGKTFSLISPNWQWPHKTAGRGPLSISAAFHDLAIKTIPGTNLLVSGFLLNESGIPSWRASALKPQLGYLAALYWQCLSWVSLGLGDRQVHYFTAGPQLPPSPLTHSPGGTFCKSL